MKTRVDAGIMASLPFSSDETEPCLRPPLPRIQYQIPTTVLRLIPGSRVRRSTSSCSSVSKRSSYRLPNPQDDPKPILKPSHMRSSSNVVQRGRRQTKTALESALFAKDQLHTFERFIHQLRRNVGPINHRSEKENNVLAGFCATHERRKIRRLVINSSCSIYPQKRLAAVSGCGIVKAAAHPNATRILRRCMYRHEISRSEGNSALDSRGNTERFREGVLREREAPIGGHGDRIAEAELQLEESPEPRNCSKKR